MSETQILHNNYALIVGVGMQQDQLIGQLPTTVNDARAIRNTLVNPTLCGFIDNPSHTRLLVNQDTTKQNVLENLGWLQQASKSNPNCTVLIYFSGHGTVDGNESEFYLIPCDAKVDQNRQVVPVSAIASSEFNQAIKQIRSSRLLIVIDSCHAQGMASSKQLSSTQTQFKSTPPSKSIVHSLSRGVGRAVFTSCLEDELSYIRNDGKLSIFTQHFIEALKGAANSIGDVEVRVSDIMNHLSRTVSESTLAQYGEPQNPYFDFSTENFPVALIGGGKGLTALTNLNESAPNISINVTGNNNVVGDNNSVTQSFKDI